MLTSLKIEDYRCFKSFELKPLGRVNLIVGKNNVGKTSILEAIDIALNWRNTDALEEVMKERGEAEKIAKIIEHSSIREAPQESDHSIIRSEDRLFIGKLLVPYISFCISLETIDTAQTIKSYISKAENSNKLIDFIQDIQDIEDIKGDKFYVKIICSSKDKATEAFLYSEAEDIFLTETRFLNSTSLKPRAAQMLYNSIVLNPEEDDVIDALRILEPRVERIAADPSSELGKFYIRLKGAEHRTPLKSMGDGMWRILSIALSLVAEKGGVLLIDEIDTGLHYTAMVDMWWFIWKVAKKLDVQVFATTHNSDCWRSLAAIANEENPSEDGITIHRIEKGASRSIVFEEPDIVVAAENDFEVR